MMGGTKLYWACLLAITAASLYALIVDGNPWGLVGVAVGAVIGYVVAKALKRRWGWR